MDSQMHALLLLLILILEFSIKLQAVCRTESSVFGMCSGLWKWDEVNIECVGCKAREMSKSSSPWQQM